jgi:hypothetical protein
MVSRKAPTIGDENERRACERFDLDSRDEPHYDAVRDGVPIEVKGCQRWLSAGADKRERGRFRLWSNAHEALVDEGGEYLFVVYGQDGDPWYFHDFVDATEVTPLISWQDHTHRAGKGNTGLLWWPYIFPEQKE